MSISIGFLILSHSDPENLLRLTKALDREYDYPQIVCHHDFGQSKLDTSVFGHNVEFVRPHIATGWARPSLVWATLKGLSLLYRQNRPDWFFLLSASDYPVKRGCEVKEWLANASCDALLDARALDPSDRPKAVLVGAENPKLAHFNSSENHEIKRRFYRSRQFWLPIIRLRPRLRLGKYTYRPKIEAKHPYEGYPCFYGDMWFAGSTKVADALITRSTKHVELMRHLKNRTQADETYFATVLMNEPDLTICRDNKRFADWNGGGAHPMTLTVAQVDEACTSGAFFARKFALASDATRVIDQRLLDGQTQAGVCRRPDDHATYV